MPIPPSASSGITANAIQLACANARMIRSNTTSSGTSATYDVSDSNGHGATITIQINAP
jgi:hypothetical protein